VKTTWITSPVTPSPVNSIPGTRTRVPISTSTTQIAANAPLTAFSSTSNQNAGGVYAPTNQQSGGFTTAKQQSGSTTGSGSFYTPAANAPLTVFPSTSNQNAGGTYTPSNQNAGGAYTPSNQQLGSSSFYTPAGNSFSNAGSTSTFITNPSSSDSMIGYTNATTIFSTTANAASSNSNPVRTRYLINSQWSEWTTSY
jgi:hypothetical protein